MKRLIETPSLFPNKFTRILYIWPTPSSTCLSLKDKKFLQELRKISPNVEIYTEMIDESHIMSAFKLSDEHFHTLLIFDDMQNALHSEFLLNLYCRYSNHANL